jgi:L-type amino acid transporter 9
MVNYTLLTNDLVVYIEGNTQYLENGFEGTTGSPSVIALAFYDGLWAYDGW